MISFEKCKVGSSFLFIKRCALSQHFDVIHVSKWLQVLCKKYVHTCQGSTDWASASRKVAVLSQLYALYEALWLIHGLLCYSITVQQSIHGSLRNQGVSTSGVPYVTGSDGFTVQEVTKVIWG